VAKGFAPAADDSLKSTGGEALEAQARCREQLNGPFGVLSERQEAYRRATLRLEALARSIGVDLAIDAAEATLSDHPLTEAALRSMARRLVAEGYVASIIG